MVEFDGTDRVPVGKFEIPRAVVGDGNVEVSGVVVAEPGATTQQPDAVFIRAHFKAECRYDEMIAFLDGLSRGRMLVSIERFNLVSGQGGRHTLDLWVSRYILKRTGQPS